MDNGIRRDIRRRIGRRRTAGIRNVPKGRGCARRRRGRRIYDTFFDRGGRQLCADAAHRQISHPGAAQAEGRPGDPGGRTHVAQVQGRHAHHGRHHVHPGCGRHRVHPGLELHAGGGVLAPLRVSLRPDLRPDRLCGRLPQGPPAPERGTDGPAEVHPSAGGGGGVPGADAVRGS